MSRALMLLFAFLLGVLPLTAAPDNHQPPPVTDPVQVAAHLQQVLGRPEFAEVPDTGVNSQFKEWLSLWFLHLGTKFGEFKYASRMPAFESLLMTLLVALSITGMLYTLVRLTRRRGRMEMERPGGAPGPRAFLPAEAYDEEIAEATRAADWHRAWLAAWRQFLSRLENRHLVEPDRTRTNREYLLQLRAQSLPPPALALLAGMVEAYDRFIYGHQAIAAADLDRFRQQLAEAALLLHLEDKVRLRLTPPAP